MRTVLFCCLTLSSLTGPANAQTPISWSTLGRNYREQIGQAITLVCPPGGSATKIWGSGTYTDDSSICTAAVHSGVISFADGGTVVLLMKPGQNSYAGSNRNGVTSDRWAEWDASFSVIGVPKPPDPPRVKAPPPAPSGISWQRSALGLAPNGRRFTFVCRPPAVPAPVKGVDLYSWDSSICNAAVHAGAITRARGGAVTIEMRPGEASYPGSVRNGVATTSGAWTSLGFVFVAQPPPGR